MPSAPTAPTSRARRSLAEALDDPGFTPRRGDLAPLLELLGSAESRRARVVEAAILRIGPAVAEGVLEAATTAEAPLRGRALKIIGRWAAERPELVDALLLALQDEDAKTQRNAIIALGKLDDPRSGAALLKLAAVETRLPHLRSLTDALGKVGGAEGLAWLRALDDRGDAELARLRAKALLIAERSLRRQGDSGPGQVDLEAEVTTPCAVELRCRAGLEELLLAEVEELAVLDRPGIVAQGVIRGLFRGRLRELYRPRLALEVVFPLCWPQRWPAGVRRGDEVAALVACLSEPALRERLRRWTEGALTYRLDLHGGHRRSEVWRTAEQLAVAAPELVNDPTASVWEVRTLRLGRELGISLVPRAVDDRRFSYRCGDVPAASHPTIAAALARLLAEGGSGAEAVVWDPFVGSGLELCERGLMGPYGQLWGSDIDPEALRVAEGNLDSAGLERVQLVEGDACELTIPGGVSSIISNPPLGRRVHRGEAQSLLCDALPNLARNLRVGGCLVWITPEPRRTEGAAQRAGLQLERWQRIDLGGFAATAERWRRTRAG